MRIFLTGATGFVGHHVAHALAAQGAQLRMLVRKTSNLANQSHIAPIGYPSLPFTVQAGVKVAVGGHALQ